MTAAPVDHSALRLAGRCHVDVDDLNDALWLSFLVLGRFLVLSDAADSESTTLPDHPVGRSGDRHRSRRYPDLRTFSPVGCRDPSGRRTRPSSVGVGPGWQTGQ